MDNGAWDYPADTRGYTEGFAAEYRVDDWTVRLAEVAVPTTANGQVLEYSLSGAHAEALELERRYELCGKQGTARAIYYHNVAHMGSYRETINTPADSMNIIRSEASGRVKFGFGIDIEQKFSETTEGFLRAGWNDGETETWAFTEIDRSISAGLSFNGGSWNRPLDFFGIAAVANGLSTDHKDYLADGGYGFIIGDGRLYYALEEIAEGYYLLGLSEHVAITGDVQGILHPAYNADRGPIVVYSLRAHFEF